MADGKESGGTFDVRRRAAELPNSPGVYTYLDSEGRVLYIGKARNLRKRVAAYTKPHSWLIPAMLERARSLEYTVTKTEREALILEAGMVRHHKPKYNVRLKDDKRFPYLKLTKERFPRLLYVRKPADDGALYFGLWWRTIPASKMSASRSVFVIVYSSERARSSIAGMSQECGFVYAATRLRRFRALPM